MAEFDYKKHLPNQRSSVTPIAPILEAAGAAQSEFDYIGALGSITRPYMQGAKVAGSYLMDMLAPLDKPRGAVSGARVAAFETPSVTDERSFGQRVAEGAREGFAEPPFPKIPIPERFEDTALGKEGEVGGGVSTSILEDPWT